MSELYIHPFSLIQDLTLMQQNRDRCKFLSDFAQNVLQPLQKTTMDPFSGNSADVNAFGWGFASAASRALRNPNVIKEGEYALVPGIDIVSHSFTPNCEIVDTGPCYVLRTLCQVGKDEELTVNYGPFSNDELLSDYGFTVDNNPHDRLLFNCDPVLVDTARGVMGQQVPFFRADYVPQSTLTTVAPSSSIGSPSSTTLSSIKGLIGMKSRNVTGSQQAIENRQVQIGRGDGWDEQRLHQWQVLDCFAMYPCVGIFILNHYSHNQVVLLIMYLDSMAGSNRLVWSTCQFNHEHWGWRNFSGIVRRHGSDALFQIMKIENSRVVVRDILKCYFLYTSQNMKE